MCALIMTNWQLSNLMPNVAVAAEIMWLQSLRLLDDPWPAEVQGDLRQLRIATVYYRWNAANEIDTRRPVQTATWVWKTEVLSGANGQSFSWQLSHVHFPMFPMFIDMSNEEIILQIRSYMQKQCKLWQHSWTKHLWLAL